MQEKMQNICSKGFSIRGASPLLSETLVQGTESSVQLPETSTVVVTTPASEAFHLMPFASIFGNQGITLIHSGKELVIFRQMMHLKAYKSHSKVPEQESFTCVVFRYTDVVMVLSESRHSSTSRKDSILSSDSFSTMNCIHGSILFRWLWKDLTMSLGRAVQVSST